MTNVTEPAHQDAARRLRQLHARFQRARDLIQLGAYVPGHDADLDLAVRLHPRVVALLQQDMRERADLAASRHQLQQVLREGGA
jgi:flagellum-specific ATP synthase